MKVLLVNGSPHQSGCTFTALSEIAQTLQKENIESEIFWIGKAGFAEWKQSAFFVSTKNEPNPQGGLTPKGSVSISAKQKAEGNTRFRSHFFFCFISWHISCLCCFTPLVVYKRYTPAVVHCQNTTCSHDISPKLV